MIYIYIYGARPVRQGQLFEKIDSNQDGELSRTELQVSFLMFFFEKNSRLVKG